MRRAVKQIIKVILIFALIMCFGISLGYVNNIKNDKKMINFYFEETKVNVEQLKYIRESNDSISMIGWLEKYLQSAYNPDFNRTINDLKVLLIDGNSSLIIKGPLLFEDHKAGCLIDEDTAYKLFGSTNVIGKEIVYNDRALVIRGMHSGTKSNIIVQLLQDSTEELDGLSLDGTELSFNEINELGNKFGFKEMPIDGGIYHTFAKVITMIFPIIALLLILIKIIGCIIKSKRKIILQLIYISMAIIFIAIFINITNSRISIPLDMIPNKWSDFDFWGKLYNGYIEKLQYVMYMKKQGVDIYNIENLLMATLYSLFTIILFVINLNVIKIKNIKELIVACAMLVIISFIVVLAVWSKYNFDVNITMIWLLYPLYLLVDYFMNTHEKYFIYEESKVNLEYNN